MRRVRLPLECLKGRFLVGVFLLLTIFFLPLHFHAATAGTAQFNKECSCLQGSRAQLGPTAAPLESIAVAFQVTFVPAHQDSFVSYPSKNHLSRAPPAL